MARVEFAKKQKAIEKEMELEVHWECKVEDELRRNAEMRKFFDNCDDTGPLNPHDAFHGARTGPLSLRCDLEEDAPGSLGPLLENYEIRAVDFISLYPSRNFFEPYPIGHPKELVFNEKVNWTSPEHNEYLGLVKCFLIPPKDQVTNIHISHFHISTFPFQSVPVVAEHCNGKLMFFLCNACAKQSESKSRRMHRPVSEYDPRTLCNHGDRDRGFVSTLDHIELNKALSKGYRVSHLYSVYHWDPSKWTTQLFRPYVQRLMKIKVECGGWPKEVGDDPAKQQAWIDEYYHRFNILIDPKNVKKNAGMKYIAKM
jgi:hypothetical protein